MPDADASPSFSAPVDSAVDLGEVYAAAKIAAPPHGYTVLKVADMLQSEHIQALPADVKRKSIMVALDAAGVKVNEIVEDAVRRDRALDTYERVLEKHLEGCAATSRRREPADRGRDRAARRRASRAGSTRTRAQLGAEQREFLAWRTRKHQEEATIAEPSATSCPRIRSRRPAVRQRTRETPMFARLSRLFRAWMGFFISLGEDPEVMLQDAIEEMRMTMPKLNSVLVATRATVIRLEEERDALLRQEQAASRPRFRRRCATDRRPRAASPKKTPCSCSSCAPISRAREEQLAAAQKAHESAKMSVDALKAKLKEQDRDERSAR